MKTENKLFEPKVDKLRFTITIDVYENCCGFAVKQKADENMPTYHEVIGVLESQKNHVMMEQHGYVKKKKLKVKNPNNETK